MDGGLRPLGCAGRRASARRSINSSAAAAAAAAARRRRGLGAAGRLRRRSIDKQNSLLTSGSMDQLSDEEDDAEGAHGGGRAVCGPCRAVVARLPCGPRKKADGGDGGLGGGGGGIQPLYRRSDFAPKVRAAGAEGGGMGEVWCVCCVRACAGARVRAVCACMCAWVRGGGRGDISVGKGAGRRSAGRAMGAYAARAAPRAPQAGWVQGGSWAAGA